MSFTFINPSNTVSTRGRYSPKKLTSQKNGRFQFTRAAKDFLDLDPGDGIEIAQDNDNKDDFYIIIHKAKKYKAKEHIPGFPVARSGPSNLETQTVAFNSAAARTKLKEQLFPDLDERSPFCFLIAGEPTDIPVITSGDSKKVSKVLKGYCLLKINVV